MMMLIVFVTLVVAAEARNFSLPTVFAHGMGDSCFNPGMEQITEFIGNQTNTYAVCIPTGPDQGSDTNNGFFHDDGQKCRSVGCGDREKPQTSTRLQRRWVFSRQQCGAWVHSKIQQPPRVHVFVGPRHRRRGGFVSQM